MATITDFSTIFSLAQFTKYTGLYSGSQGSQDFTEMFINVTEFVPMAQLGDFNSTSQLTTGFHTYFKVQGYNPLTGTYETWHCRDVPILLPPSGHDLLNVGVVASWIDR
jgi:hypothetical protein